MENYICNHTLTRNIILLKQYLNLGTLKRAQQNDSIIREVFKTGSLNPFSDRI
jgi:hypothetical protein